MTTRVQKWGNSLAVRIPRAFAEELGVKEDSPIELRMENRVLVISFREEDRLTLEEMLDRITPENVHPETDWGPPVGKEVW